MTIFSTFYRRRLSMKPLSLIAVMAWGYFAVGCGGPLGPIGPGQDGLSNAPATETVGNDAPKPRRYQVDVSRNPQGEREGFSLYNPVVGLRIKCNFKKKKQVLQTWGHGTFHGAVTTKTMPKTTVTQDGTRQDPVKAKLQIKAEMLRGAARVMSLFVNNMKPELARVKRIGWVGSDVTLDFEAGDIRERCKFQSLQPQTAK